jgi:hypothetical protein
MGKTLSNVPLDGTDGTLPVTSRVLQRIAAWIIRRAVRRAEVELRNDRVRRHIDAESTLDPFVLRGRPDSRMTSLRWVIPAPQIS